MIRTIVTRCLFILLTLIASLSQAGQSQVKLDDFSYGSNLAPAESEYRRFSLTQDMINNIENKKFSDLRVFDGDNNLMPSLLRKISRPLKTTRKSLLPVTFSESGVIAGFILDLAAEHKKSLKSLEFLWKQGAAPTMLTFRLEQSADRKLWKPLKKSETIVNYNFKGKALNINTIDINNKTQRYIKLTILNKKQPPILESVVAVITSKKLAEKKWFSAGKIQPDKNIKNGYRFMPSKVFVPDMIKFNFNKLNTMITGSLYNMAGDEASSQKKSVINHFNAFVVTLNNKVIRSKPVELNTTASRHWFVVTDTDNVLSTDELPEVKLAYPEYELIFASDGDEPYTAVWGNNKVVFPSSSDFVKRIKAASVKLKDIPLVKPGSTLSNSRLHQLMESRETNWIMILFVLLLVGSVIAGSIFGYKHYRLQHGRLG